MKQYDLLLEPGKIYNSLISKIFPFEYKFLFVDRFTIAASHLKILNKIRTDKLIKQGNGPPIAMFPPPLTECPQPSSHTQPSPGQPARWTGNFCLKSAQSDHLGSLGQNRHKSRYILNSLIYMFICDQIFRMSQ